MSSLLLVGNFLLFGLVLLALVFSWFEFFGIKPTVMAMTITYSVLLTDAITDFVWEAAETEQHMVSVERIRQYLDIEPEKLNKVSGENVMQAKK